MQDYKDTYLENQTRQIARLQTDGKSIAADELCWLLGSSTIVYRERLCHFQTYEDEEMLWHSFPTGGLSLYRDNASSGIAGSLKNAQ